MHPLRQRLLQPLRHGLLHRPRHLGPIHIGRVRHPRVVRRRAPIPRVVDRVRDLLLDFLREFLLELGGHDGRPGGVRVGRGI